MSMTPYQLKQKLREDANAQARQAIGHLQLTEAERDQLARDGEQRRQAVEATPAQSYRSLRAAENGGRDSAERR